MNCRAPGAAVQCGVPVLAASLNETSRRNATAWSLVESAARLLWQNLWALVFVNLLCDPAIFLLHRASHRLTNEGV